MGVRLAKMTFYTDLDILSNSQQEYILEIDPIPPNEFRFMKDYFFVQI